MFWIIAFCVLAVTTTFLIVLLKGEDFMAVIWIPTVLMGAIFFGAVFDGFWWPVWLLWIVLGIFVGGAFYGLLVGARFLFPRKFRQGHRKIVNVYTAAASILSPAAAILSVIHFGEIWPMPRWVIAILGILSGFLLALLFAAFPILGHKKQEQRREKAALAEKQRLEEAALAKRESDNLKKARENWEKSRLEAVAERGARDEVWKQAGAHSRKNPGLENDSRKSGPISSSSGSGQGGYGIGLVNRR